MIPKNKQYYKFCLYGFLKNQRFFEPFLLLFFLEQGISYFQIGILFSVREFIKVSAEIPTGIVADKWGRKYSMILCFISYIFSFLIFYFFQMYYLFVFAMVLFGLGEALRSGTHKSMIFRYLDLKGLSDKKSEYYGHTRSWSKRGSALSALIAGALVFYSGSYKIVFLGSLLPYIADLFLMISYPQELNKPEKLSTSRKEKFNLKKIFNFLKSSKLRNGMVSSMVFGGFFKSIKEYLQPIMETFAVSFPIVLSLNNRERTAVILAVVYSGLFFLTSIMSQNASKISGKLKSFKFSINFSYLLGGGVIIASGLFYHFNISIMAVLFFILLFLLQNFRKPLMVSYLGELLPDKSMATGLSTESQVKTFLIMIFSPIIGLMADNFGVGTAVVSISVLLMVIYPFAKVK